MRREGPSCRRDERAGDSDGGRQHQKRPQSTAGTANDRDQCEHGHRLRDEADCLDTLPGKSVGNMAGDKHEQQGGSEFGEPEQAEVQLASGPVVHRLAERHGRHCGGHVAQYDTDQEATDLRMAKRCAEAAHLVTNASG